MQMMPQANITPTSSAASVPSSTPPSQQKIPSDIPDDNPSGSATIASSTSTTGKNIHINISMVTYLHAVLPFLAKQALPFQNPTPFI